MPQGPSRKETIEAIKKGNASPTPEFAAELHARASNKREGVQAERVTTSLEKKIQTMNVVEVDAFIKHLNNLVPVLDDEHQQEHNTAEEVFGTQHPDHTKPGLGRELMFQELTIQEIENLLMSAEKHKRSLEGQSASQE